MPTNLNDDEAPQDVGGITLAENGVAIPGGEDEGALAAAAVAAAVAGAAFAEEHCLPVLEEVVDNAADDKDAVLKPKLEGEQTDVSPKKPKKKRICKFPGCEKTVKSQGHCQRHGAKAKRCKHPGCELQSQGSHEGYCKRHWREFAAPEDQRKKIRKKAPVEPRTCEPVGTSVYDAILPASFMWKSSDGSNGLKFSPKKEFKSVTLTADGVASSIDIMQRVPDDVAGKKEESVLKTKVDEPTPTDLIPILKHLLDNEHLDAGWHRINERLARGLMPQKTNSIQLESWEKQLAVMEMALIAGTDTRNMTAHKTSKLIAHAWGRVNGFHKLMIDKHCSRRGDVDRKKRVDAGTPMSEEKKAEYKAKAKKRKLDQEMKEQEEKMVMEQEQQQEGENGYDAAASVPMPDIPPMPPVPTPDIGGETTTADPMAVAAELGEGQEQHQQLEASAIAEQYVQEEAPPEPAPTEELPPLEEPTVETETVDV